MKVVCSFYENDKRLAIVLRKFLAIKDVSVLPIKGTYIVFPSGVRCVGDCVEFLVVSKTGGVPVLLTTNQDYSKKNKEEVEYSVSNRDNIYMQTLGLCVDKGRTSKNQFKMECAVDGCTVVAEFDGESVTHRVKAPRGEGLLDSGTIPEMVYNDCKGLKSFRYLVVTDTCEKEVSVRKGQLEVFREIAHYINKSIVFVKYDGGEIVKEYCITATGCCELVNVKGRYKVVKVSFTRTTVDPDCFVYAVDATLDTLLRSRWLTEFTSGEV